VKKHIVIKKKLIVEQIKKIWYIIFRQKR